MSSNELLEKRILKISLISGIVFVLLELGMAVYSGSQSILMDTAFDAAELIVILASLLLTPLLYKPMTETHPFGYAQCESLFIIIKGFMLISVTISLIFSNIQVMISGGNQVDNILIAKMEICLSFLSFLVLLLLSYYGKKLSSPIISAELYGWKVDVICGFCVALAFFVPSLLKGSFLEGLSLYFDQIIAVILALLMLPEPVRLVVKAFKDLLLFAPQEDILEHARTIALEVCSRYQMEVSFVDVHQTGRKTWMAVTIDNGGRDFLRKDLQDIHKEISKKLENEFEDIYLELIPLLS